VWANEYSLLHTSPNQEEFVNTGKLWIAVFSVVVICTVVLPLAQASTEEHQTLVTFTQPVEIPGKILPAGTYLFVLTGDTFDRNLVRVYSADRRTVYATAITVPSERLTPAEDTLFTFAERQSSKPEALLKWFSPGETTGHEFHYHKPEEQELLRDRQQVVVVTPEGSTQVRAGF
jgi:hypothetical protein